MLDALEERARGFVVEVLGDEAASEGGLEDGLAHVSSACEPVLYFRRDLSRDRHVLFDFAND